MSSPFGTRPPRGDGPRGLAAVREVLDEFRRPGQQRPEGRTDRSAVRTAVLTALAEQPGSGYQLIRVIDERGLLPRTPTAGAVYPMLQLLADEGLATAVETDGRKVFTLTDAGRAAAASAVTAERLAPEEPARSGTPRIGGLTRSGAQLAQAVAIVARTGTPQQAADAIGVLDEARRKLFAILARN